MLPCLVPSWPQLMQFASRSDLVLISFWMLTIPWIFHPISSFYRRMSRFEAFQTKVAHLCFYFARIELPLLILSIGHRNITVPNHLRDAEIPPQKLPTILWWNGGEIHLWSRSRRGHCRTFSANFHEISANFPQNFLTLSWCNKTYFPRNFREFSAEFPQTFRKNPFANAPISELLSEIHKSVAVIFEIITFLTQKHFKTVTVTVILGKLVDFKMVIGNQWKWRCD